MCYAHAVMRTMAKARRAARLGQKQLAQMLGVEQARVSRVERGLYGHPGPRILLWLMARAIAQAGGRVEPLGEEEVAAATILYRQLEEEVRIWASTQPRRKARKKRAGLAPAQEVPGREGL